MACLLLAGTPGLLAGDAHAAGVETPPASDPKIQRIQLHRNGERSINYVPLRRQLQPERTGTLQMRVIARIDLDGDPLANVRGNVYPIDVDGNGSYAFLHYNGYRFMRIYNADGTKRWQIDDPKGRVHKDTVHRDTLAVLDIDGDRKQEIIHCWANHATGSKRLVIRRGTNGSIVRQVDLDAPKSDICQLGVFYVTGRPDPIILVSHRVKAPDSCDHNFTDYWARTVAYDLRLNKLWDRNTCNAGHYVYPVDANFDGYAEAIFVGRHLFNVDGTQRCRFPFWGSDHADAVNVADFVPARSGMEAIVVGASGLQMVDVDDCTVLWTKPKSVIDNPQHLGVAWLDPNAVTPTITVRSKGTVASPKVYMLDGSGRILKTFATGMIGSFIPIQNANLDGAQGSDDLVGQFAQVADRSGGMRLTKFWYWNLKGTKVQEVPGQYPYSYDRWSAFPVVADLDRDGRDEIVEWSQSLIVVGKAVD
ncbi:hypothetical protein [Benzoatithermus flavus]|uniref:VCBS repeat-containing protein n=1 Tax=Benzoatithermus flavus TaxID=3108223 RepID=A0ABU8XYU4_9PROT